VTALPQAPGPSSEPQVRSFLARLGATFRFWAAPSSRPLPRVEADLGWWVPVWLVTLCMGGIAVVGAALVTGGPIGWLVIGGIILVLVLFSEGPAIGIYAITIGVLLLASSGGAFEGRVFTLVAVVHLVAVLDSLVSGLPWRARLQIAALRDPVRRFASVQVAAQGLAMVGALLTGTDLTMAWLPAMAALGLAVLSWALNARLEARGAPEHRVR
jgi:hypothetical protein